MRARAAVQQAVQYGLVIFALTTLIGLANASQLFGSLDQDTRLAHVLSGTAGWITLGVIGIAIWMFAREQEDLFAPLVLSALTTAAYVMAFWSGDFILRAVFGLAQLAVVIYWWWFAYARAQAQGGVARLAIPKLSVLFGLTVLLVGALGVLIQVFAGGSAPGAEARSPSLLAAGQTGGYFVLVAAGFAEWQLTNDARRTTLALAQVYLLFVGALMLAASLILDVVVGQPAQAVPLIAALLILAGVGILAFRVGRAAVAAPWMAKTGTRHIAVAVAYLVVGAVLGVVVAQQLMGAQGDASGVSAGFLSALDHAFFVGVMTNVLFGAILLVTAGDRGTTTLSKLPVLPRTWPWADDVIFWGLNVGTAAFIAVLIIVGSGEGKPAFTHPVAFVAPIMGLAALLGIVTYLVRMLGTPAFLSRRARA
jgi:hypothetical protein